MLWKANLDGKIAGHGFNVSPNTSVDHGYKVHEHVAMDLNW